MLSCTYLADVARGVKLNTFRIQFKIFNSYVDRSYAHRDLIEDLRKYQFIPSELQLCHGCEKYLPKHKIWRDKFGIPIRDLEYVDWLWTVAQWTNGGKICPTCQIGDVEAKTGCRIGVKDLSRKCW